MFVQRNKKKNLRSKDGEEKVFFALRLASPKSGQSVKGMMMNKFTTMCLMRGPVGSRERIGLIKTSFITVTGMANQGQTVN